MGFFQNFKTIIMKRYILIAICKLFLMSSAFGQYCSPASNPGPGSDYIQAVYTPNYWVGSNGTGAPFNYPYYTDYTSSIIPYKIAQGGSYSLWVLSGPGYLTCAAYIDFNADFDFDDAGELIGQFTGASANQISYINYTVPVTATSGTTRMRLRSGPVLSGPCNLSSFSEAEDYSVFITTGSSPYCYTNFYGFGGPSSYINSVNLGSLSNVTGQNSAPYYTNYTNPPANLNVNGSYTLTVQTGADQNYYAAWIDYNHNNVFNSNEKLGELTNTVPNQNLAFNFSVPSTALSGNTRMRVRNHNSNGVDPCSGTMFGETEDYTVNIQSGPGSCSELFFSEYLEGSSNDKALEIYNPGNSTVNLSFYTIETYNNGSLTVSASYNLSGSLAANSVYVLANPSAGASILSQADATNTIIQFNGKDAVVLKKNGNLIDMIGEVGVNPGSFWSVGTGSTLDHTLVRNFSVSGPQNSWTLSQNEWTSYPINTTSYLGNHSSACNLSGLANLDANNIILSIFPNPFIEYISIESEQYLDNVDYSISDSFGREVLNGKLSGKLTRVSMNKLAQGVYFLKIKELKKSIKLIKL